VRKKFKKDENKGKQDKEKKGYKEGKKNDG
jgi:hypothetical protein